MRDSQDLLQLYPDGGRTAPLAGLYLADELRSRSGPGRPFVYSNYVLSLDGRISLDSGDGRGEIIPDAVKNPRDWRLFQELAAQADVLLTTGRYLRDYAAGKAQEVLRTGDDPALADLADWRRSQGLHPLPDMAVISGSLDFPLPEALFEADRRVFLVTTRNSDGARRRELARKMDVFVAGENEVNGEELIHGLGERGARTIYNASGPQVNHTLLAGQVLDRLYLTYTTNLLGGEKFSTIVEGQKLDPPRPFRLERLYFDPAGLDGLGQLFATYNRF